MSHPLNYDIRERLGEYLAHEISLEEFEDWFIPETWDIDQTDDLDLLNLVYGIKLRLAEFSNNDCTEDKLRSLLRPFIERYVVASSKYQLRYGTSNTSSQVNASIIYSAVQSFDTGFLEARG